MRVAVLALDGFPYRLLKEVAPAMPTLSKILDNGTWGKLVSTIPYVTATAWTSFMTGKNPGRHGVFGFFSRASNSPSDVGSLVAGFSIKDPTLWGVLSKAGFKVGVFGVPMTYKPEPVNGFLISGFPLPRHAEDYTQPPGLQAELKERGWNFADVPTQAYSEAQLDSFYAELKVRVRQKTDAVLHLLGRQSMDFFMVHYFETDKVLHDYLNFRYPTQTDAKHFERYGGHVQEFFAYLDSELERVVSVLPPSANIFVVSDHGLSPGSHVFLADTWLLNEGYMKVKRRVASQARYLLFKVGITPELAFKLLPGRASGALLETFMGEYWEVEKPSKENFAGRVSKVLYKLLLSKQTDIDWDNSTAYSFGGYGVFNVYLRVEDDAKKNAMTAEVVSKLRGLTYHGELVFDKVLLAQDVYVMTGQRGAQHDIPDIMAYDEESEYVALANPTFFTSNHPVTKKYANKSEANHDRNGIIAVCGPEIANAGGILESDITDVFPTILHYFGLGIPRDVDGRLIKTIFKSDSEASRREPAFVEPEATQGNSSAFNEAEESEIVDKLRRMGYV
ncbi:MAG: alkaline phosphatase family protein [Thaumarchaeota archaeon]|nr:alkaline phosphatase family protein [Nitrososphaerota archaeon]